MSNLLVGQSGGPTSVINATLAGVIKNALASAEFDTVYGTINGIEGIINNNFISLEHFRDEYKLRLLAQTPASYLGSCRVKLPSPGTNDALYEQIFSFFRRNSIACFLYIGGNDSMDTVQKLSEYAKAHSITDVSVIGVPKTIDNDLCATDHSPGYGSAAKFIANSVRQLACDADVYDLKSVLIVEIMGRNAGWLTAAAALANDDITCVDLLCLPEHVFDIDAFAQKISELHKTKNTVIAAVSEGIKTADGKYLTASVIGSVNDKFGHIALGGVGASVAVMLKNKLGVKTRAVELNTLQRAASAYGSARDCNEAFDIGFAAVEFAKQGLTAVMAAYKRISDEPYKIEIIPADISLSANYEKKIPQSMLCGDYGVNDEFIKYAKPLIEGEPERIYENGIYSIIKR